MSVTDLVEEVPGLDAEGRPDPAYAESLGLVGAGWGARSTAFVIDALLMAVLVSPLWFGVDRWVRGASSGQVVGPLTPTITLWLAVGGGLGLVGGLVQTAVHGRRGVTLGKSVMGLRSVDVAQFGRIGFGRALRRVLVLLVSSVVVLFGPYLLLVSGVWDREGRGRSILDRLARCWVVDTRDGIDPFDTRALRRARRALNLEAVDTDEDLLNLASGSTFVPRFTRSKAGVIGAGGVGSTWEEVGGEPTVARPPLSATRLPQAPAPFDVRTQPASDSRAIGPAAGSAPGGAATVASAPTRVTSQVPAGIPEPGAPVGAVPPAVGPGPAGPRPVPAATTGPSGGAPRGQAQPPAVSGPVVTLVLDNGERFDVEQFALVGRAPQPQPGDPPGRLVAMDDPTRALSKTHAEIRAAGGGWWIADRGSSNGTTVWDTDGRVVVLQPGQHAPLRQGTRARLGGRMLEVRGVAS